MSDILDIRSDIVKCDCESPVAKWWYRGKHYSIDAEYTDFCINSMKHIYILNADKSIEFYAPDGCLLMHYNFQQHTMHGIYHYQVFDDRISFIFNMNDKLHWFSGGKLYSAPFDPWSVRVSRDGSYMKIYLVQDEFHTLEGESIVCRPDGTVIARWKDNRLNICSKNVTSHKVAAIRMLEQYDLIAALCDTENSGYADKLMIFDLNGAVVAEIDAAEQGYSCIYCLDTLGVSCPCIGFMKERPRDIDYTYTSGFNISTRDIDPSWYDILYDGKNITLKYAYGMTEKFYRYNVVECR